MAKMELVHVLVDREKANELFEAKIAKARPEDLVAEWHWTLALYIILYCKMLVSAVGTEKAKETSEKVIHDFWYKVGKTAAQKLGDPRDLDSFLEEYLVKMMGDLPVVPPIEIVERTKNKCIFGVKRCLRLDAVKRIIEEFPELAEPETMEVVKAFCAHDEGWAKGFNPEMRFERIKFLFDGDDGCFFECEVR